MSHTFRPVARIMVASAAILLVPLVHSVPASADSPVHDAVETHRDSVPVADGVTLESFDRWAADGWLQADAITVDLMADVSVDYAYSGEVASTAPMSEHIREYPDAVAAINGDFFDINNTDAPLGVGIHDSELVTSPEAGHTNAVALSADGLGSILQVEFEGSVTLPDGEHELAALNTSTLAEDTIGEYTTLWGDADRARVVGDSDEVFEVTVSDGVVTSVSDAPGAGPVSEGSFVLLGRERGADVLSRLEVGDEVVAEYSPRTDDGQPLRTAVGGNQLLIVDGELQQHPDNGYAPRAAVGFSSDGSVMYLMTVDGRQAGAEGVTVNDMAELMAELGAHNALNIDGGGSATLLARKPGSEEPAIVNSPSDGTERPVPNGLVVSASPGSGSVSGYTVSSAMDPGLAPGDAPMAGGTPERVFPGLTRSLTAVGYDETYGPAVGDPTWWSLNPLVGDVDDEGLFTARHSGTTRVAATDSTAFGHYDVTVLGPLARITSSDERVGLADEAAVGHFGVIGYDSAGYSAPVDPGDVTLDYDSNVFDITPDAEGFVVEALVADAAGLVTVDVDGHETTVAVTVGLSEEPVADFEDADTWSFSAARADGHLESVPGHTGDALGMVYDFTQDTATRAAYATPEAPISVPGQPQSFSMWIDGSGDGEWPTLQFADATGAALLLRSEYVTWEGWRQVRFEVPPGTAYPLTLTRIYVAEVDATASYHGRLGFDELVAEVPPEVDTPDTPPQVDPTYVSEVTDSAWRFAVMSDAQFVAADPDSDIVKAARRTLAEIKEADPDLLIVNGDLVDEGSPADLAFARRILAEELGDDLDWVYVPGNHEVMGGDIDNFIDEFGEAHRTFDHKGTRFITLDTSGLSVRTGGFEQMTMLREQLDAAATDPTVNSVVVVSHVPPRDPLPQAGSQLGDRKDALIVEKWLSDFAVHTGKGIGFVGGHVGVFHASHVDGVPYVINGNSGKSPAAGPEAGGFTGWTEFGVTPVSTVKQLLRKLFPYSMGPQDWLRAATRVRVDDVTVTAPETLAGGEYGQVETLLTQDGAELPLTYPMSADWSDSDGVYIGTQAPEENGYHAWFDPGTGRLTAVEAGTVTLTVTVNGVTRSVEVVVT